MLFPISVIDFYNVLLIQKAITSNKLGTYTLTVDSGRFCVGIWYTTHPVFWVYSYWEYILLILSFDFVWNGWIPQIGSYVPIAILDHPQSKSYCKKLGAGGILVEWWTYWHLSYKTIVGFALKNSRKQK